jgi:translation initiation factor IF-1
MQTVVPRSIGIHPGNSRLMNAMCVLSMDDGDVVLMKLRSYDVDAGEIVVPDP